MSSVLYDRIKAGRDVRTSFRRALVELTRVNARPSDQFALTALDADPSDENTAAVFGAWVTEVVETLDAVKRAREQPALPPT